MPAFKQIAPGQWAAPSALTLASVPSLWREVQALLGKGELRSLALDDVREVDSAALAFLLEIQEVAALKQQTVLFQQAPPALLALANLSNLSDLLFPAKQQVRVAE